MIKTNSLSFRLISGATLWIIGALLAGGLALSALFRESVEQAFDSRLTVQLEALMAASNIDGSGNFFVRRILNDPRFERAYSGWYWQIYTRDQLLARSRSLWDQTLKMDGGPIEGRYERFGVNKQKLRLVGRSIAIPGYPGVLTYVVTGDVYEIETEIAAFNKTLLFSLGGLGLGLILAVFIQVGFGLLPLRRMLHALAAVRVGEESRLKGKFPLELQTLANEMNGLISHNREVLQRARTHVGNLAHALKTPLSVLTNESNLSDTVAKQTAIMHRHINHYLAGANAQQRQWASWEPILTRCRLLPIYGAPCCAFTRDAISL